MNATKLFEDDLYTVEHAGCPIPGYLIVRTKTPVHFLSALPAPGLMKLGPLLAQSTDIIQQVVAPERIYFIRLGEEVEAMHFHLFPRSALILEKYRQAHPNIGQVSGAQIFDWARLAVRSDAGLFGFLPEVIQRLSLSFQTWT